MRINTTAVTFCFLVRVSFGGLVGFFGGGLSKTTQIFLNSDFQWSISLVYNLHLFRYFFIDADYCPLCGMYSLGLTHMPKICML